MGNASTRHFFGLLLVLILLFSLWSGVRYEWPVISLLLGAQVVLIVVLLAISIRQTRMREDTKQTAERYRQIINKIPVALSCFDKEKNIIFHNDKYDELLGEFTDGLDAWLRKAHTYKGFGAEVIQFRPSGAGISISTPEAPVVDGGQREIAAKDIEATYFTEEDCLYAVFSDITGARATEEALRNSRELLSLATSLAHLGPWEFDHNSGLFSFGDEFYAIYGTDVEREGAFMTAETYIREFVHPDDAWKAAAFAGRGRLDKDRNHYELEHRIIRRDGEVRTINVRINVIRDRDGEIVRVYGANQDITEYKRIEAALHHKKEEIRRMAYMDTLTRLPNRAHINERLKEEMAKARRGESAGTVLFVDLDDLKTVNDSLGHTYGDVIISEAGQRIVTALGHSVFVGRIGGDEFLVILPGLKVQRQIVETLERLIGLLSQDTYVCGERFQMSASIGAAIYPDDGDTAEEIFKNADNAMYAAKNAGKNGWRFYDAEMQVAAYEKMMLTKSLRNAVENNELMVYYQPQTRITDGKTTAFEALLRWRSPEHGMVMPSCFIPLAEESGLINKIGNWVLCEACGFARRLADKGWDDIYVAVNLSPHQICMDSFVDSVRDAIIAAGIEPRQLELEITENALIVSLEETISKLAELNDMGVRLALDDFGKGYSSLTYLQRLPVRTLKIEKSFTDMIMLDGKHKAMIESIVHMAHVMDMRVLAEGVETAQQLDYLAQCRCDLLQGFVVSRPVPEDQAVRFLPAACNITK